MTANEFLSVKNNPESVKETLTPLFTALRENALKGLDGIQLEYGSELSEYMTMSEKQQQYLKSLGYKVERIYYNYPKYKFFGLVEDSTYTYLSHVSVTALPERS